MSLLRRTPDRRARVARATALGLCALLLSGSAGALAPASAAPVTQEKGLKTWWYTALGLEKAHRETTGKGVKIAVIDEAIDPTAPELRGANVKLGKDCDGNRVKPATGTKADHGTAVTTLISGTGRGTGPGGRGIRGVAPGAEVTFYADDSDPSDEPVDCFTSETYSLMKLALSDHPDIITTSLDLGYNGSMRPVVKQALDQGIVLVGDAGQKGRVLVPGVTMTFPGAVPGAVAVLAGDRNGRAWSQNPRPFRSFINGNPVITGPGVDVPGIAWVPGVGWQSGRSLTGTSFSAPIVAGALALVKSKYPDATGNQLIQQLIHNPSSGKYAWDRDYGFGLLSMSRMLATDPTAWPDVNPLRKGPRAALADYPMSSRGASASASPSPSAAESPSSDASAVPDETTRASAATADSGGVPVWVWPLGAVVVLAGAGAGVAANKRGSRSSTSGRTREEG
ncbi:S8/S53 family peptidase [Nocardioides panacis]|uniref:S8/S53 family peptidase n=1 Tax=Nocardioides panacis TaxID=2849501 RepID=A0A975Y008_9ACTN|nr:S8/S53 family peptidase [Nocardioides panacis]QWZ07987.1 S8/S53 family peptidase [Nocardioides panacis]